MGATPRLFDQVFVSARSKDIGVFQSICENSLLANSIQELIYDITEFCKISERQFFRKILFDFHLRLYRDELKDLSAISPDRPPLSPLFADLDNSVSKDDLFIKHSGAAWIREGFLEWQRVRNEENELSNSERLLTVLHSGMSRLQNLNSIDIDYWRIWGCISYPNELLIKKAKPKEPWKLNPSGSPFSRSWNIL